MGVEAGDLASFETGATRSPNWVLGMLADLEGDPGIAVVRAPYESFMLESGSTSFRRGMDTPDVRGGEFSDASLFNKRGQGLFEGEPCREGPDWGPLSLERDRRGGILRGVARHQAVMCLERKILRQSVLAR